MSLAQPRYGTINEPYVDRLRGLSAPDDGPLLMLNLMKYRPVADYEDGRVSTLTGRQADDAYAPLAVLAELGAQVVLFGEVIEQVRGNEGWDRVAIVRYPSAASFFAMQERPDFHALHVHKDAGMERTIIALLRPTGGLALTAVPERLLVDLLQDASSTPGAWTVEGWVVGDGRDWSEVRLAPEPASAGDGDPRTAASSTAVVIQPLLLVATEL